MQVEDEEESSDDELLMKTGKTTLSFKEEELPALPKKSQRRLRIDVELGSFINHRQMKCQVRASDLTRMAIW